MDGLYRLPPGLAPTTLVDLGGNIGLTTLWLATHYPTIRQAIVVEPAVSNAELAVRNLAANSIEADVIQAAIAPRAGTANFVLGASSNLGYLGDGPGSVPVPAVTMNEIVARVGGKIDVLKFDIEGGEGTLFTDGDLSWLDHVGYMTGEFHPSTADYPGVVDGICDRGFTWYKPGDLWAGSGDMFVRSPT